MHLIETKIKKLDSNQFADIFQGLSHNFYELKALPFTQKEREFADYLSKEIQKATSSRDPFAGVSEGFLDNFSAEIVSAIELSGMNNKMPSRQEFVSLLETFIKLLAGISFIKDKALFAEFVLHNSIGLRQLAFFSLDDGLEELMVNSPKSIFVFHKQHGMCKTNIEMDERDLTNLVQRIAITISKDFNQHNALLDARLPDGSRVNATISDISPNGVTLTIRKFASTPLTILDLIDNGTITSEAAAFLWLMVEGMGNNPQNVLITGGTTSGKTTLLNVLSNFVRLNERVVSIEDTVELSLLSRENWIPLEARVYSFAEITMDSLLKNAMRMRPDRIIVGEVRGPEALTMFMAMDTGHKGCMGTIHANNSREALVKLQERPLSVPQAMLPLLNFIVVLQRHYSKETGMRRRVVQIVELSRMEDKVLSGVLFDYDTKTDTLSRTEIESRILEEMAQINSLHKNDLKHEINIRKLLLEWMIANGIRKPLEVLEVIESYYYSPEKVVMTVSQLKN